MNYVRIASAEELPDLSDLAPFKLVLIAELSLPEEEQARVAAWLVASGCLYAMSWGEACASWQDEIDMANRAAHETDEIPDESIVITTSHEDEPLSEAFWFAKHTAIHPCTKLENVVLLHIAAAGRERELLDEYAAA